MDDLHRGEGLDEEQGGGELGVGLLGGELQQEGRLEDHEENGGPAGDVDEVVDAEVKLQKCTRALLFTFSGGSSGFAHFFKFFFCLN